MHALVPARTWARFATPVFAALCAVLIAAVPASAAPDRGSVAAAHVPVIFVHGQSGSAQQFETNAMRLTSNGYPHDRLFAYEYDTSDSTNDTAIDGLDGFIADVQARTGASRVDVLAHSRGTTVMHAFLATPERAAQVRRYVNFDGRTSATEPGGVPTLAVWGEGDQTRAIGGAENVYFPNKAHTEVTTSAAAFADVYEFLAGTPPATTDVVPEDPTEVTVAGRALVFPNNVGIDGGRLRVFEIREHSGQRVPGGAVYSKRLDETGAFGPFPVYGAKRYEFAVTEPDGSTIHNYPEPFERDDHFYRVLNAPALEPFIEAGPNHVGVAVTRMREWWGDEPGAGASDRLTFNGLNVITPGVAPRDRRVLAVFNFDKDSDGVSHPGTSLAPFNLVPFLTGVDNYMPASPDASGRVVIRERMRTPAGGHTKNLNVPDWPSDEHTVSVYFKDYVADAAPADVTPPKLRLRGKARQRPSGGIRVKVSCGEECDARLGGALWVKRKGGKRIVVALKRRAVTVEADKRRAVKLVMSGSKAKRKRIRRVLRRGAAGKFVVRARAADPAGNRATARLRGRLR